MNDTFLANLLDSSPGSYARDAVRRLRAASEQDHGTWQESFTTWIGVLAAALRTGRPSLFASHLTWLRAASEGRSESTEFLAAGINALHKALSGSLPEGAEQLLAPYMAAAEESLGGEGTLPPSALEASPFASDAIALLQDLVRGNAHQASVRVRAAVASGAAPSEVILQLLLPVERELGRLWHLGELSIAEEHFATRIIRRALGDVLSAANLEAPERGCIVLAGVAGDEHDIGIAMLGALCELEGWRAIDLGANIPAEELARTCTYSEADVALISASMATQLQAMGETISTLRQHKPALRILVGGYALAGTGELWKSLGADGYSETLAQALDWIQQA